MTTVCLSTVESFIRAYLFSLKCLCVMCVLGLIGTIIQGWSLTREKFNDIDGWAGLVVLGGVGISTVFIMRMDIIGRPGRAVCISSAFAVGFAGIQFLIFDDFLKSHGEGPNGEGAPGAMILAMVIFALLFTCPWVLTAKRGLWFWMSGGLQAYRPEGE